MPYVHKRPPEAIAFSPLKAAAACGLRPEKLLRAIHRGELRAVRVGNHTIVTREWLHHWLATFPPPNRKRRHTIEENPHVVA